MLSSGTIFMLIIGYILTRCRNGNCQMEASCRSVKCKINNNGKFRQCAIFKYPGAWISQAKPIYETASMGCEEGKTYGRVGGQLWVTNSCHGTFEICNFKNAASVGDGEPETEPEGNYTAIPLSPVVVVNANKPTLQVDKTAQQVKETTQQVTPVSPVVPSSKTKRTSQQDIMDSQVAVLKEQRLLFQEQRVLLKQQLNVEVKKSEKLDLQIKLLTRLNDDNLQTLTNSQMALFSAFTS